MSYEVLPRCTDARGLRRITITANRGGRVSFCPGRRPRWTTSALTIIALIGVATVLLAARRFSRTS